MATPHHAQEDNLQSKNLQKRYNGLLTVRTRAIKGKGAWYWLHLEPILFQNQDTGMAKAIKLRCGLCSALFSASNPSRTATEHLKRGTCPNFNKEHLNGVMPKFRKHNQLALPAQLQPLAMIAAPCSTGSILPSPVRSNLTPAQVEMAFNLLTEWFYESCGFVSFSSLDHPKFKAFLHHLGLPQVNKTYVSGRNLDTKYAEAKLECDDKLRDAMFFQISTDGWKKRKGSNNPANFDAFVNVMLNLPNQSSLFHNVLILGDPINSMDYIKEVLWSMIKEISGADVYRCVGIVADIGDVNCRALRELEFDHHWMVNLTCQSRALGKLLKDFFKRLPLFTSISSLCFKASQIFTSHHLNTTDIYLNHHPNLSLSNTAAAISVIEKVSQSSHALHQTIKNNRLSGDPSGREISEAIQNPRFWEELNSVVSLTKIVKMSVQEIENERPFLGQCLPLWEGVRSRIKSWCNTFSIEEGPVMELVNRRFSKNYHQAWAASYVLDPLYLVEDSSGRYLPPYKFLTSEQEKDVGKIITRLTRNEDAHIALMELMKWRTEGLDRIYAQAVQEKERDPVTGKLRVANPRGSRLVWETYLSEFKVLRKVAARLIFLQATTSGLSWNRSFLSWVCSKSRSKNTIEKAQKVAFVSSHGTLERGEFMNEEEKDLELFGCEDDDILDEGLMGKHAGRG